MRQGRESGRFASLFLFDKNILGENGEILHPKRLSFVILENVL
ncbi:hypothetical protein HMPREF9398_0696 [Streptococcus sanguinis VMC66]|nr:hypothetical protein HMPREF9398_0696 [Streptococcus sanguinis VMC66]